MNVRKIMPMILIAALATFIVVFCAVGQPATLEKSVKDYFIPSGHMGDTGDLFINTDCRDNPHSDPECIEIIYSAIKSKGQGWAGIYWQFPKDNWGAEPGQNDIFTGAKRLTFWAKGKNGGEKAEFKMGGIGGEYSDSVKPAITTEVITLSNQWKQYSINLDGKDLSQVIGGFCWVAEANRNPGGYTLYLDDIIYEW